MGLTALTTEAVNSVSKEKPRPQVQGIPGIWSLGHRKLKGSKKGDEGPVGVQAQEVGGEIGSRLKA